jgi:hypothetical protein
MLKNIPNITITRSELTKIYYVGKLSFTYNNQIHYFNIFIETYTGFVCLREVDNKDKLRITSPNDVFIDTYYANETSGPNLDVLRAMVIHFPNIRILHLTKIRTDDYRDIPHGLWLFVRYSTSQFYNNPRTNPLNDATYTQQLSLCDRKLLRKYGYNVYLVNEFRTSCRCSHCEGECKTFRKCVNPRP